MSLEVSAAEARSLALAAQGLGGARPKATPGLPHLRGVATRLGAVQIDAVNVLVRAHYLPFFSRLGPYPVASLDRLVNQRHELVEHLGHQASYIPVALEPLLRWRRTDPRAAWRSGWRHGIDPAYVAAVEAEVTARGPLALADLEDARRRPKLAPHELALRRKDGKPYAESSLLWGRPSDGKTVLDGLIHEGRLALAGRKAGGADRLYDCIERVLPDDVRSTPTPPPADARRALVRHASRALGVATVKDLADYFPMGVAEARTAVGDLVDEGHLEEVRVEGWKGAAYLAADARTRPTRTADTGQGALLGPFDSLTWSRDRTRRLFAFDYSFEIYVPEPKRRYGYYVLPFLLGDALVARVDLKADRPRSTLLVLGAFAERGHLTKATAAALRAELRTMADWLGLERVEVGERGDLAKGLRRP